MSMKYVLLPLTFLVLLAGCGGGSSTAKDPITPEPPKKEDPTPVVKSNPQQDLKPLVDTWLAEKVTQLTDINCTADPVENEACQLVTVKFSDGEFDASKSDDKQTILILDSHLELGAILRYRSRVKAALIQKDDGYYYKNDVNDYDPSIELPVIARDVLTELDNFTDKSGQSQFIPAMWLSELYPLFEKVYPYHTYMKHVGHGVIPFTYLLEHNPKAEFVIGPTFNFFNRRTDLFCYPEQISERQSQTNLQLLAELIADAAADFKHEVIEGLGIDYINLSAGHRLASIKTGWEQNCTTPLPNESTQIALLKTTQAFYQVLFNSDNVLAAQAGSININTNDIIDIDTGYKNRVRVGDFSTLDSQLPIDGKVNNQEPPLLAASRNNSKQWIDVFVNFGISSKRPYPSNETPVMETDPLGLDPLAITSLMPSWAAPVALSWAINIKNSEFADAALDNLLIKDIFNIMTPKVCNYSNWLFDEYENKCKMQDPLLWRQHEVYRLGYLD